MSASLSLHSAPDAIEPVVGWRTWRIVRTEEGLRLTSVAYYHGAYWPARGRFEGECRRPHFRGSVVHDTPYRKCDCGIYASKGVAGAREYVTTFSATQNGVAWLGIGRVNLWGHIIEHEHGYRAQYAYPKQILLPDAIGNRSRKVDPPNLEQVASELRDSYGVPVLIVHPKPSLLDRLKGAR